MYMKESRKKKRGKNEETKKIIPFKSNTIFE